jgi:hypothetical protein
MNAGLETLNKDLIRRLLQKGGITLHGLQKLRDSGVSINVWRNVLKGKPVRPTSRVKIAEFLKVDPSTLLLLDEKPPPQPEGKGRASPRPRVYRGRARLRELCAIGDDGQFGELTDRYYYGETAIATLAIHRAKADLKIENMTMSDDPSCPKESERSYCLQGHGLVVGDSVSIRYTVKDQEGRLLWAGVCVLSRPVAGPTHGQWMTAGQRKRGPTVLGVLELELTLT